MTVSATRAALPVALPSTTEDSESSPSSLTASPNQLLFRKHKVLPHPRKDPSYGSLRSSRPLASIQKYDVGHAAAAYGTTTTSLGGSIATDEAVSVNSLPSSPRTLKHYPKKLGGGPDLPPTPPAHSRNSSSTYSALPPAATDGARAVESRQTSADDAKLRPAPPTTPTKQMSPPTPDVTPPYVALPETQTARGLALRSPGQGHDSRTGSFITAREQPSSDDEGSGFGNEEEDDAEDGHSTLRHAMLPSAKTSQSTVRRYFSEHDKPSETATSSQRQLQSQAKQQDQSQPVGLGLGLESSPEQSSTPRSRRDFASFDGEWGSGSEEVVQEWDDNLDRNVAVRKRYPLPQNITTSPPSHSDEVVDDMTVKPTNATEALRTIPLPQRILTFPSPTENSQQAKLVVVRKQKQYPPMQPQPLLQQQLQRQRTPIQQPPVQHPLQAHPLASAAPITASQTRSVSDSSNSDKEKLDRRVSTMSSKSAKSTRSTVSTVVEAFVIETPPQRRQTLRHVRKQVTLRDSSSDLSPASSVATSLLMDEAGRQRRSVSLRYSGNGHESLVSTTTATSVSSRSTRRDVIKAGGIPVVVVPERLSSVRSNSREPSLRSTSSRRSKKSQSQSQSPNPQSQFSNYQEPPAHFDRDQSRGRDQSASRRGRRLSDSDGSAPGDQRTIDYPPVVPRRTSSLSAPTSRDASRNGSLTSDSAHAHSALLESRLREHEISQVHSQTSVIHHKKGQDLLPENEKGRTPTQVSLFTRSPQTPVQAMPVLAAQTPILARSDKDWDTPEGFYTPREIAHSNTTVNYVPLDDAPTSPRRHDQEWNHEQSDYYRNQEFNDRLGSRSSFDRHGDYLGKHLSPQNTPFSMASVDTTTTHHSQVEVSEALAVNIYPHQNTSVLVVDHSNRPSESSDDSQRDRMTDVTEQSLSREAAPATSVSTSTQDSGLYTLAPVKQEPSPFIRQATALEPVTPPQPGYLMGDVDSPLRNPRMPPEPPVINEPESPPGPPAINFIPATPSGLTPAPALAEQQSRLVMDEEPEEKPRRSMSLVLKRALSRGRKTEYGPSSSRSAGISTNNGNGGILSRTLSLTRSLPRRSSSRRRSASVDRDDTSVDEDEPAEVDKLHPLWRPASYFQSGEGSSYTHDQDEEGETYRYPPIDNRPHRSISSRMKRTFAIFPVDGDDFYPATSDNGPERRTVRRTASGNLRVMKYRGSVDSVTKGASQDLSRPYTAPEAHSHRKFWRSPSFGKAKDVTSLEATDSREISAPRDVSSQETNATSAVARSASVSAKKTKMLPNFGSKIGDGLQTIPRRFSERRREKRSNELRQKISGPQEVRDGVGEVIRLNGNGNQRETRGSSYSMQYDSNQPVSQGIVQNANYGASHTNYSNSYDNSYGGTSYYDNCRTYNQTSYESTSQHDYRNGYPYNNSKGSHRITPGYNYRSNYQSKYSYAPARKQSVVPGP